MEEKLELLLLIELTIGKIKMNQHGETSLKGKIPVPQQLLRMPHHNKNIRGIPKANNSKGFQAYASVPHQLSIVKGKVQSPCVVCAHNAVCTWVGRVTLSAEASEALRFNAGFKAYCRGNLPRQGEALRQNYGGISYELHTKI